MRFCSFQRAKSAVGIRQRRLLALSTLLIASAAFSGCHHPAPIQPPADIGPQWSDHTQGLPFFLGYDAGLEAARAGDRPVMYYVTFEGCGWCKRLSTESFNDPQVRALLEKFVLVIVDLNSEELAAEELGCDGAVPYFVFKSADGKKLAVSDGYLPVTEFKAVVEHALSRLDS